MFGSTTLDIVIGLTFIYLLYSLLASILQEMMATFFGLRGRVLRRAIERMLNDEIELKIVRKNLRDKHWKKKLYWREATRRFLFLPTSKYKDSLAEKFYQNPSIKYLAESSFHSKPAYISAQNFSQTLIDILRGENFQLNQDTILEINKTIFGDNDPKSLDINPQTLKHLKSMMIDANSDLEKFKTLLEKWFDETMERAAGWYKRKIQWMLLIIGFVVAVCFNVDTIAITKKLSVDKNAREQMVRIATAQYKNLNPDTAKISQIETTLIKNLNESLTESSSVLSIERKQKNNYSFFGWVLTALAISLGASFWFDLLNKLVKIRTTGGKPDDNKQESADKNPAKKDNKG